MLVLSSDFRSNLWCWLHLTFLTDTPEYIDQQRIYAVILCQIKLSWKIMFHEMLSSIEREIAESITLRFQSSLHASF